MITATTTVTPSISAIFNMAALYRQPSAGRESLDADRFWFAD